jgi:hypothetical protein
LSKQKILFLAANPRSTTLLALPQEARNIQSELERGTHRELELEARWAVQPGDLLRELRRVKPTIVHFSGHGSQGEHIVEPEPHLYFEGADGQPAPVSSSVIAETFGAAGSSVKVVVLSACHSKALAAALVEHVDVAIGTVGSIRDDAAVSFSIGFYGGLAEGESVEVAYRQGCAAIGLYGLPQTERPHIQLRHADAGKLQLVPCQATSASHGGVDPAPASWPRPSTDASMSAGRLLSLCEALGLRANRQAQWTQVGPMEAVGHGSRDPRIFYVNHRQDVADLRRYSGPVDLMTRAVAAGGNVSNGQIVARIPISLFSEEEWHRFVRHNV